MKPASHPPHVCCRLGVEASQVLAEIESQSNTPPWSQNLFEAEFSQSHSTVFGIRERGEIIGFLVCHVVQDEAHIVNLAIRADKREAGVGRTLLKHCLEELHIKSVQWVTLEVRKSNLRAQRLYLSEGFSEASLRERYYTDNGEDAFTMRLNIEDWWHKESSKAVDIQAPRLTIYGG